MDDMKSRRKEMGTERIESGSDGEMDLPFVKAAKDTETMSFPSMATQDPEVNQDGNAGTPFVDTLEKRRGQSDTPAFDSPGGYGGPNAQ